MTVEFEASFLRDLRSIRDRDLIARIETPIENVEQAETLQDIPNLRRLQGEGNYGRIRVGDYRIGLVIEGFVVVFVRCLHRRDIYKRFP